ncbi:hypothetical protein JZU61_00780 [bacterium]|nr:hypothetical protein [bacterium]
MAYWLSILMLIDTGLSARKLQIGHADEVNPLVRFVYDRGGLLWVVVAQIALAVCVPLFMPLFVSVALISVYSVFVWYGLRNLWVTERNEE